MKGAHRGRIIGTVPSKRQSDSQQMTWQDLDPGVMKRLGITVDRVNWFSTYHVHHRVAEGFRKGRAFLLGDAACSKGAYPNELMIRPATSWTRATGA